MHILITISSKSSCHCIGIVTVPGQIRHQIQLYLPIIIIIIIIIIIAAGSVFVVHAVGSVFIVRGTTALPVRSIFTTGGSSFLTVITIDRTTTTVATRIAALRVDFHCFFVLLATPITVFFYFIVILILNC